MEERLKNRADVLLSSLKYYVKEVEKAKLTNEQWFLDWETDVNLLTVKDHNADPE